MERILTVIYSLTIEQLIIILLIVGFAYLHRVYLKLAYKYAQLDKLNLVHAHIISDRLGIKTVKIHRNGDFEIINPLNQNIQKTPFRNTHEQPNIHLRDDESNNSFGNNLNYSSNQ